MPSPIPCLECGAAPDEHSVGGEATFECASCGAIRVSRAVLARLREMDRATTAPLERRLSGPSRGGAPAKGLRQKRCPGCGGRVLPHAFGGGNVRVESCERCALVFLGRSQLAAILREAREGIELSEEAHAALHATRMMSAGSQFSAAEMGLSTGGVVALLLFLRIFVRTGASTTAAVGAGALAIGIYLYSRRKWQRQRAEATARMDRLADAELFRLDQKARADARAGAGEPPHDSRPSFPRDSGVSSPRDSHPSSSRDSRPSLPRDSHPSSSRDSGPSLSRDPASPAAPRPAASSRPRRCPVCRAPLPTGTTHCAQCDSDFG